MPDQSMSTEVVTVEIPADRISDVIDHITDAAWKLHKRYRHLADEAAHETDPEIRDALRSDAAHALERHEQLREVAYEMGQAKDRYRADLRDRYPAGF